MIEDRVALMIERYRETRNLALVAREFGLSRQRVQVILSKAGVDTSRPPAEKKPEKAKGTHGEPRPRAGRPPSGDTLVQRSVTIRPEDIEFLRKIGDGELSEGIRHAVDLLRDDDFDSSHQSLTATSTESSAQ